ncbi:MAG: hypothetical protein AB8F74_09310 [Saprospiraceae bacterium]
MKIRTSLLYLLFLLVCWTGCNSDEDSVGNDPINEIPEEQFEDFIVEPFLTEGYVDLSWNATDMDSTFVEYTLIRSRDSLTVKDPSFLYNNSYNLNIERVSDTDETMFRDSLLPLVGDFYYQLFVKFKTHFLRSKPVRVVNPVEGFNLSLWDCEHLPESDYLFFSYDYNKGIIKYNLKSRKIEFSSGNQYLGQTVEIGDSGFGNELLVKTGSPGLFSVLNVEDFSIENQFQLEYSSDNLLFSKSGYIIANDQNNQFGNYRLVSIDRSNWEVKDIVFPTTIGKATIQMLSKESNSFFEASPGTLYLRNIDNNGIINTLNEATAPSSGDLLTVKRKIAISPDGNLFIPYTKSIIFNKDLELVHLIDLDSDVHLFSSDGEYLFLADLNTVYVLNTSDYNIDDQIDLALDDVEVKYLFEINNELIIVSTPPLSTGKNEVLISRFSL